MAIGVNITKSAECGSLAGVNKVWFICSDELDQTSPGVSGISFDVQGQCACVDGWTLSAAAPGATPGFRTIDFDKDAASFVGAGNNPTPSSFNIVNTLLMDISRINKDTSCQINCFIEYVSCCKNGLIMIVKDNNGEYQIHGLGYSITKSEYTVYGVNVGAATGFNSGTVSNTDNNFYTIEATSSTALLPLSYCGGEANIPLFTELP